MQNQVNKSNIIDNTKKFNSEQEAWNILKKKMILEAVVINMPSHFQKNGDFVLYLFSIFGGYILPRDIDFEMTEGSEVKNWTNINFGKQEISKAIGMMFKFSTNHLLFNDFKPIYDNGGLFDSLTKSRSVLNCIKNEFNYNSFFGAQNNNRHTLIPYSTSISQWLLDFPRGINISSEVYTKLSFKNEQKTSKWSLALFYDRSLFDKQEVPDDDTLEFWLAFDSSIDINNKNMRSFVSKVMNCPKYKDGPYDFSKLGKMTPEEIKEITDFRKKMDDQKFRTDFVKNWKEIAQKEIESAKTKSMVTVEEKNNIKTNEEIMSGMNIDSRTLIYLLHTVFDKNNNKQEYKLQQELINGLIKNGAQFKLKIQNQNKIEPLEIGKTDNEIKEENKKDDLVSKCTKDIEEESKNNYCKILSNAFIDLNDNRLENLLTLLHLIDEKSHTDLGKIISQADETGKEKIYKALAKVAFKTKHAKETYNQKIYEKILDNEMRKTAMSYLTSLQVSLPNVHKVYNKVQNFLLKNGNTKDKEILYYFTSVIRNDIKDLFVFDFRAKELDLICEKVTEIEEKSKSGSPSPFIINNLTKIKYQKKGFFSTNYVEEELDFINCSIAILEAIFQDARDLLGEELQPKDISYKINENNLRLSKAILTEIDNETDKNEKDKRFFISLYGEELSKWKKSILNINGNSKLKSDIFDFGNFFTGWREHEIYKEPTLKKQLDGDFNDLLSALLDKILDLKENIKIGEWTETLSDLVSDNWILLSKKNKLKLNNFLGHYEIKTLKDKYTSYLESLIKRIKENMGSTNSNKSLETIIKKIAENKDFFDKDYFNELLSGLLDKILNLDSDIETDLWDLDNETSLWSKEFCEMIDSNFEILTSGGGKNLNKLQKVLQILDGNEPENEHIIELKGKLFTFLETQNNISNKSDSEKETGYSSSNSINSLNANPPKGKNKDFTKNSQTDKDFDN